MQRVQKVLGLTSREQVTLDNIFGSHFLMKYCNIFINYGGIGDMKRLRRLEVSNCLIPDLCHDTKKRQLLLLTWMLILYYILTVLAFEL